MSNLEFEPPKYARVVLELRRRIEEGEFAPGQALPSEAQLVREFAVGRTTVVRALELLKKDGWITREHGRGTFVRGRPVTREEASRPGLAVLDQPETGKPVVVGLAEVSPGVASLMGVGAGERMLRRRWVNIAEGVASELVTCWFPPALAYGTDLDSAQPIPAGIREHLRTVKDLRIDHIVERLTARLPAPDEAELLGMAPNVPVLAVTASVRDAADASRFGVEVLLPGDLHDLEDRYSVPD